MDAADLALAAVVAGIVLHLAVLVISAEVDACRRGKPFSDLFGLVPLIDRKFHVRY